MVSGSGDESTPGQEPGEGALGELYDAYAPGLYDYAHGLLGDEIQAADALRDSLIAAQELRSFLRQPELHRAWLYALLRAECAQRGATAYGAEPRVPAVEPEPPAPLSAEEVAMREEIRNLAVSALAGLGEEQREIVLLSILHGLDDGEVAAALGLPALEATGIVDQARADLDTALTAIAAARSAGDECVQISPYDWPWPLAPEHTDAIVRHVAICPACREHRPAEVAAERVLSMLPIALLPEGLRTETLTLALDPRLVATRLGIAERIEPLDSDGWPLRAPGEPPAAHRGSRFLPGLLTTAAVLVAALFAVVALPQGGQTLSARIPLAQPSPDPPAGQNAPKDGGKTVRIPKSPATRAPGHNGVTAVEPVSDNRARPAQTAGRTARLTLVDCILSKVGRCALTFGGGKWRITLPGRARPTTPVPLRIMIPGAGRGTGGAAGRQGGCNLFGHGGFTLPPNVGTRITLSC